MASGWRSSGSQFHPDVRMKILAKSGSLRAGSSNSAILRVAARVARPGVVVELFTGIDSLPFFNPDLDREFDDPLLPQPVRILRAAIAASDAILISSPLREALSSLVSFSA